MGGLGPPELRSGSPAAKLEARDSDGDHCLSKAPERWQSVGRRTERPLTSFGWPCCGRVGLGNMHSALQVNGSETTTGPSSEGQADAADAADAADGSVRGRWTRSHGGGSNVSGKWFA